MNRFAAIFLILATTLISGCGAIEGGMAWFTGDPQDVFVQGDAEVAEFYADIPYTRLEDGGFVLGSPDALITIVEFADFACPHCQTYHPTMKRVIEELVVTGMARFEYRMFISAADPTYGPYTAQLAECADELEPGAFWRAHDALYEFGAVGRFNDTTASALAARLSLDENELRTCAEAADQWQTDVELGRSLGVQATPTVMIRLGDSEPQYISAHGQTYNRGPVPYEVLQILVQENQPEI